MNRTPRQPISEIHLRVYEPLEAFPDEQRRIWSAYLAGDFPENRELAASVYEEVVRANAVTNGPRLPREAHPRAYVARFAGQKLICPVSLRFHSIRAVESRPDLFAPTGLAHSAAHGLLASLQSEQKNQNVQRDQNEQSGMARRPGCEKSGAEADRVRTRIALWAAPVSWLTLFDPNDRFAPSESALIMRAPVQHALARLEAAGRALKVIRGDAVPVSSEIAGLREWLNFFHPKSLIELDYGGTVIPLLSAKILSRDDQGSAYDLGFEELIAARAAVHLGDIKSAVATYRRVNGRIKRARMLAVAS